MIGRVAWKAASAPLLESAPMRVSRSRIKKLLAAVVFVGSLLFPAAVWAQQVPTPGVTPEVARPWTYYLSFPILLGVVGLVLLIGLSYVRLSSRFFAREEPPKQPVRRPQFATAAQPAATAGPARVASEAAGQSAVQASPSTRPAPAPAAEAPQAEAEPKAEAPPAPAAAPEHVEPDQEVYERALQEQLDKGVDRRVAEGRAKAAAVRAAKAGAAGGGAAAPAAAAPAAEAPPAEAEPEAAPAEGSEEQATEEAEAGAAERAPETPETKEPTVVEEPSPETPETTEAAEASAPTVEAPATEEAAPGPAGQAPPAGGQELDQETFDRILQEQLAKGLDRKVAESRARAAAIKVAREKS